MKVESKEKRCVGAKIQKRRRGRATWSCYVLNKVHIG